MLPYRLDFKMAAVTSNPSPQDIESDAIRSGSHEKDAITRVAKEDDSDDSSQFKQDGVKQVEAVTQVWSKKTMWTVFGLYVSVDRHLHARRGSE